MNIDKAIEIKEVDLKSHRVYYDPDLLAADKLSIEALKQVKESRFDPSSWEPKLLPGETKD